jgi:hypothetical protein
MYVRRRHTPLQPQIEPERHFGSSGRRLKFFANVKAAVIETSQESRLKNKSGLASFVVVDPD